MSSTILLIDDDRDLLPSMVALLEELSDFHIVTAENGVQGLERVVSEQPDCIVVDIRMPQLYGYQFVQTLRGDPATSHIPLIILSALIQERDEWIGLAVGVDRYLRKPVSGDELIQAITEVTQLSRHDRLTHLKELAQHHHGR